MKVCTAVIAYLPQRNDKLMELTQRSVTSTRQFEQLGETWVYHAQDSTVTPGLCGEVHSCFGETSVVEYHNGSLGNNWEVFLKSAFGEHGADWAMFVSNDVIWMDGAYKFVEEQLSKAGPMTYFIYEPTAIFIMSRKLWDELQPTWVMDYLPCSWEDIDLAAQVWAAGGTVDANTFKLQLKHELRGTIRSLGDGYRNGTNATNNGLNMDIFYKRWGRNFSGPADAKPKESVIAEWRERRNKQMEAAKSL